MESKVQLKQEYTLLKTIPGVGTILSLTIMLETGPIDRFPKCGNYASYCRKVPTRWIEQRQRKRKAETRKTATSISHGPSLRPQKWLVALIQR